MSKLRKVGEHSLSSSLDESTTLHSSQPIPSTDAQVESNLNEESTLLPKKPPPRIIKQLIPLKITLFLWYGGATSFLSFFIVYFSQLGLTIAQISMINIISPFFQCFGPSLSGWIADKIGRSKPVLIVNLLLTIIATNCMLLIPTVNVQNKIYPNISVMCGLMYNHTFELELFPANCTVESIFESSCSFDVEMVQNYSILLPKGDLQDTDLKVGNAKILFQDNSTSMWCINPFKPGCNLVCSASNGTIQEDNTNLVVILSFILVLWFFTTLANTYRFMDITSMSMVKSYNSDFGRERIWAILGIIVIAPLTGYLIELATSENGPKNLMVAFYIFDVLLLFVLITVLKLNVRIDPPGQEMVKKTMILLKNPDILAFSFTLLALGTACSFYQIFSQLFLDGLGAPSMVLALQPTVNSVLGIPFLYSSNYWVKKVGATNMIILALLCYTAMLTGYSFLINPWWCLSLEVFRVPTYHLLWVSVVRHSHDIAPEGLTSTVISTSGGIHYALGRGTGSLIGGLTMSGYGPRWANRVVALICLGTAIGYALFLYIRKRWFRPEGKKQIENGRNNW